jgi:hypothetical protein
LAFGKQVVAGIPVGHLEDVSPLAEGRDVVTKDDSHLGPRSDPLKLSGFGQIVEVDAVVAWAFHGGGLSAGSLSAASLSAGSLRLSGASRATSRSAWTPLAYGPLGVRQQG